MGKGKKKMKLIASALAIGAGVAAVNAVRKKNAEGGQGDSPKSTEKKGMPEERKEELKQFRNTERGKYEKNSKGIYYTNGNYEAFARPEKPEGVDGKSAYLVGSGLASLAAACFLVRDAQMPGKNIHILEAMDVAGGACDGINDPTRGYVMRGGREMENHFECLWDLFRSIPSIETPGVSVLDEYYWLNKHDPNYSLCRATVNRGEDAHTDGKFNLSQKGCMEIMKLFFTRDEDLYDKTIEDVFDDEVFKSDFWLYWRTMFAFENWHSALEMKLYFQRFIHHIGGLPDFSALKFTKYNQYESLILPMKKYLEKAGVKFEFNTEVTNVEFDITGEQTYYNSGLAEGMSVIVRSRVDDEKTWLGTISKIDTDNPQTTSNNNGMVSSDSQNSESATNYYFYVQLADASDMLLGQHVFVEPDYGQSEKKEGIWLDESYIVNADDDPYVWVKNDKDKLEKRTVGLGDHDDALMMYEIKSGLSEDDYIVWASDDLYEGEKAGTWDDYDPSSDEGLMTDETQYIDDGMTDEGGYTEDGTTDEGAAGEGGMTDEGSVTDGADQADTGNVQSDQSDAGTGEAEVQ